MSNPSVQQPSPAPTPQPQQWRKKPLIAWQLWGIFLVVISGSIGYLATSWLLNLSPLPKCTQLYLPFASASDRLYCAQTEADKGRVENLLNAIALMDDLPADHPLHQRISVYMEDWADQILALGEQEFQRGELKDAIAIAKQIPGNSQAYDHVEDRIQTWQEIWQEGKQLVQQAELSLQDSNWNQAFRNAVKLTQLNNRYWATTKYEELIQTIEVAREDITKLDQAYAALRRGDADSLLKAMDIATEFNEESYAYNKSQTLIESARNQLLKVMQGYVEKRQWQELGRVANKIPARLNLQEQVIDWNNLANAGIKSDIGTVASLESAIVEAQKIEVSQPLYEEAQALIRRWELEIEGVSRLAQARQFAQGGTKGHYQAAITEARLISTSNPRYQEAQREIKSWNRQIKIFEDEPILTLAKQWANGNTIPSWQRAIEQARLIQPNRPLYDEAQRLIKQWQDKIEIQEDQPILNQATALANAQNFTQAIQVAEQIRPNRALYSQARGKIQTWRQEIQGAETLQRALSISSSGNPQDLAQAIRLAQSIPSGIRVSRQSNEVSNRWSYQLLALAQEQANISVKDAIATAQLIPSSTSAYGSAQAQIEAWENLLKPPVIIMEPVISEE